jgi:hypothetical protein
MPGQLQGDVGARLLAVPVPFARIHEQHGDGICCDKVMASETAPAG